MPIKLPKAFPRRKSSGNALEDYLTTAEPSFRVLDRPSSRSSEGPDKVKRLSQGRPLSAGHLRGQPYGESSNNVNANNRGSGATNNSASSGGQDNSSTSARFSSSSSLPSSTDVSLEDKSIPKPSFTMPAPAIPESSSIASLKAAGRAFSFGRRKAESRLPALRPNVEHTQSDGRANYARERAYTESSYTSESTATPPRLFDAGLDFGSTDNLGLMFEGFGKRSSQIESDPALPGLDRIERPNAILPGSKPGQGQDFNVPTISPHGHVPQDPGSSPKSWVSHDSHDGLISRPVLPPMERTFSYEGVEERIDYPSRPAKSSIKPLSNSSIPASLERSNLPPSDGLCRSSAYAKSRSVERNSNSLQDDDASLVMNSIAVSRQLDRPASGGYQDSDDDGNTVASLAHESRQTPSPHMTAGAQQYSRVLSHSPGPTLDGIHVDLPSTAWQPGSVNTTPRAKRPGLALQEERSMFDASPPLREQSSQARRPKVQAPPKPQTQNKVMTPAQFEKYRKEQEMNQTMSQQTNAEASDDEGDDYEDYDELERNKELAKQRRKQEAHLAVYRQQMMKVTGEQPSPSGTQIRPSMDRSSMSAPNLQHRASSIEINFDKPSDDGKASDDEDEDVPLGVLAAHGFPSKNRPPTAMSGRESRIQYKSESYPPPPASTSGASQAGRASGLPPFAKNLPQDPYYGASLVNPSNRESLAYGHQGPTGSPASNPPNAPPAGLVGVIAGEERAKAARRGSPNAQGNFSSPLPQGMGQMPGMPPGMPPVLSPGEKATVQMSEQMSQMMQVQMQWMQQMQQMMASGMQFQPGQPMPMLPGQSGSMMPLAMPPMSHQLPRPASSGLHPRATAPGNNSKAGPAMSMMDATPTPPWPPLHMNNRQSRAPSVLNAGFGGSIPGYTPSIAPSERSNVGMPSRYRPVSIAHTDEQRPGAHSRSSTINSNTLQPGNFGRDSRLSTSRERKSNLLVQPVNQTTSRKAGSDDDDEVGWEEMKKKRDKKRGLWRLNRKKEEPVESGLEYYDYSES